MPLSLTVRSPDGVTQASRSIADGGRLVIGRTPPCDLVLPDPLQRISARHCLIDGRQGGWTVTDGSTNGTTVNGERISAPRLLADADILGVGDYRIELRIAPSGTRMNLDSWQTPRPASPAGVATASAGNGEAILTAVAAALAALEAERQRARRELGLPGAAAPEAPALAAQLRGSEGVAAALALTGGLTRHQGAALPALQAAFNDVFGEVAPAALRQRVGDNPADLWRAYEAAFGTGLVDDLARAFAAAYVRLAD